MRKKDKEKLNKVWNYCKENKEYILAGVATLIATKACMDLRIREAELQNENDNLRTTIKGQSRTILEQQFTIGKLCERLKEK